MASDRLGSPLATDDFDEFLSWRVDELGVALAEASGQGGSPPDAVDPRRERLDSRIEDTELRIRRLIEGRLDGDTALVPSHLAQRVRERIDAARRRRPGDDALSAATLGGWLESFDLRELQEVVVEAALGSLRRRVRDQGAARHAV